MSREVKTALTWMAVAFLGVLMMFTLGVIASALFDGPGPDKEYVECLRVGGTYERKGTDEFTCEVSR